jgi:hypothetical protein
VGQLPVAQLGVVLAAGSAVQNRDHCFTGRGAPHFGQRRAASWADLASNSNSWPHRLHRYSKMGIVTGTRVQLTYGSALRSHGNHGPRLREAFCTGRASGAGSPDPQAHRHGAQGRQWLGSHSAAGCAGVAWMREATLRQRCMRRLVSGGGARRKTACARRPSRKPRPVRSESGPEPTGPRGLPVRHGKCPLVVQHFFA